MSGDQEVAPFNAEPVADPRGLVVWLKVACRGTFGQRVTGAPERFGRLARAQLAAVPHHVRTRTESGGLVGKASDVLLAANRERTPRVDFRADRVAVMNEENSQCAPYAFSPARIRTDRRFSGSGSGQVVNGLKAHGGLYASLKSSTVVPSGFKSA